MKSKKYMIQIITTIVVLTLFLGNILAQRVKVDDRVPEYKKKSSVSGNANSIGSDTMNNLMALWLEGFKKYYPNVNIQIEGKGSSTAPPALIEATAQFGPMSRKMKDQEIDAFEAKYGFSPTIIRTSMDALAVFVHKDNPLECLTLSQTDAVFSKTRKRGGTEVATWGKLGLKGEWANKPISIYGRNSASGTYGFFKSEVLKKGDYKDVVKEQPGSASVVQGITEDKYGIGYSGIGYKTSGVKVLELSEDKGDTKCYSGSLENVVSGKYPLARYLFLVIVKEPNNQLDPLINEFIKYILSKEGQQVVIKDGYMPLTYEVIMEELKKLD